MRKLVTLVGAIALVFVLSAGPAAAQTVETPPVVVDRTALTLTYLPTTVGVASATFWNAAVSYQFGREWDAVVSFISPPTGGTSAFRVGGRYHLRRPGPQTDVFATIGYFSSSAPSTTHFELGAGLVETVAPGLRMYAVSTYNSNNVLGTGAFISTNLGFQYEINRVFALVVGYAENTGLGYLGFSYDFTAR